MMSLLHLATPALAMFQATQLNLFERFLTQAVAGIDATSITSGMQKVAYILLLIGFLWQVYQAALHGGDVRGLGTNLIKYVVTAVVVMNYHAIFTAINQGFVNAGNWVNSASGAANLFDNWTNDLKTQFSQIGFEKLWGLVTGSLAGLIDAALILVAYVLYPVVIAIFGFFYILYGSILYIFGPIIIALMPLGATSRLAKSYAENVFIWNAWPVLYGGFGALLSAVQMGQIGQMLNQNNFLGGLGNLEGSILIGLASIIYSLAIGVIPFIAKKIVNGDVGSTAGTLLGAAATALTAGIAAGEGVAAGISSSATSTGAQTASASSSTTAKGASGTQGNQPATAQRDSGTAVRSSSNASGGSTSSPVASPAERMASSIRGNFENAMAPAGASKGQAQVANAATSTGSTSAASSQTEATSSSSSPKSTGTTSSLRSTSGRGPTSALTRPHGVATWGAYHAARIATQGAAGGARAAGGVAKGVASTVANPVETAGKVGSKAGQIAGNAMNASEKTAATASKVANAVTHPRETVGAGVQAIAGASNSAVAKTTSTIRQSAKAVGTNFSEAYEKTRSGKGSKDDKSA